MAVNYKDLGLVNTREMFKRAINGGWAVPAFNFNNLEQLQHASMLTKLCFVTWQKVLLSMQKS